MIDSDSFAVSEFLPGGSPGLRDKYSAHVLKMCIHSMKHYYIDRFEMKSVRSMVV